MAKYIIQGGNPLKGIIKTSGNKNAALPCVAACLLTAEEVVLKNIPDIEDIKVMFNIIKQMGGSVNADGEGTYRIKCSTVQSVIPPEEIGKIRAGILFAGPILARTGEAIFPPPGGDVIGRRRLDTHFLAFEAMGASVKVTDHLYNVSVKKVKNTNLFLDEASVTGTENAIMMASLVPGVTVIDNAACEPHVQDLCRMLGLMGCKIEGIGSNRLVISGVEKLHGCEFRIGTDFMEVGSFIGLAAACKSELTITGVDENLELRMVAKGFEKLGITWQREGTTIFVPQKQLLKIETDLGGARATLADGIWPSFPTDIMSIMIVTATQCEGTILFHEKMFESRLNFTDKLVEMGANITIFDPHRAMVTGKTSLHGMPVSSPDVRAGMAMVIAALCAQGTSEISNIYQVERGYEHLSSRLFALGANIQRVEH